MATRFRVLMFSVTILSALLLTGAVSLAERLIPRFPHLTIPRKGLLVLGFVLTFDTIIVSQLSNYNLGVILPAFFGIPMIVLAFILPCMDHGLLNLLKWTVAALYGIACVIFIVCGFLMFRASHGHEDQQADAIIVLGAAVHGEKVTWVLSNRLDAALEYMHDHPETIAVVSGGCGDGESVTEASAMKKYMVAHGMDEYRIFEEDRATNTLENFRFSKAIISKELGNDASVAYVTTGFHVFRAGAVAKKIGINAFGIPAEDVWYIALNNFMRECVGICVYALRGDI